MAAGDAILNPMKLKLDTWIDDVVIISNLNLDHVPSINVIFDNFLLIFENKMAASDAILNSMIIKLGTSIDNVNVIANLNFEDIQSLNVIFVNFLVFL